MFVRGRFFQLFCQVFRGLQNAADPTVRSARRLVITSGRFPVPCQRASHGPAHRCPWPSRSGASNCEPSSRAERPLTRAVGGTRRKSAASESDSTGSWWNHASDWELKMAPAPARVLAVPVSQTISAKPGPIVPGDSPPGFSYSEAFEAACQ